MHAKRASFSKCRFGSTPTFWVFCLSPGNCQCHFSAHPLRASRASREATCRCSCEVRLSQWCQLMPVRCSLGPNVETQWHQVLFVFQADATTWQEGAKQAATLNLTHGMWIQVKSTSNLNIALNNAESWQCFLVNFNVWIQEAKKKSHVAFDTCIF